VEIEILDINEPGQIAALRSRLAGRKLDILFANAGITTADEHVTIGDVTTEEFMSVMLTNAQSLMCVIESLQGLVPAIGIIGGGDRIVSDTALLPRVCPGEGVVSGLGPGLSF
jgi:NAD(P)-dependent dehydrogenase (short-subunit alcohol dehydrogenase family)